MVLVTGAASFLGWAVVRQLMDEQHEVRCLVRPSPRAQQLPAGVTFSTVSANMNDLPSLRTAMQDVTAVLHLAREEEVTQEGELQDHVKGTENLIAAAQAAGVRRFIYLSRLEADQASAYPLFRAKGGAEVAVRESELDYTILRSSVVYGPGDHFTNMLVMLAKMLPFVFPIPDAGMVRFQPLWVEDLAACIVATLERDDLVGRTLSLGGPEHFTLEQMVRQVLEAAGMRRYFASVRVPLIRTAVEMLDLVLVHSPTPLWWLDLVAVGSATELGSVSRHFDFEPCRFVQCLGYLRRKRPWRRDFIRYALDLERR